MDLSNLIHILVPVLCIVFESIKYEQTLETIESKPVTKTIKVWCWNIKQGFRCNQTITEMLQVSVPRVFRRTKIVPKCCDGYVEDVEMNKCIPLCKRNCLNGSCTAPNTCSCYPGFYGFQCEKPCPPKRWGKNCSEECECLNNGKCDRISGSCKCEPGWRGDRCSLPCSEGYYGYLCNKTCFCINTSCHPVTGDCINLTETTTTAKNQIFIESTITTTSNFFYTEEDTFAIENETFSLATTEKETKYNVSNHLDVDLTEINTLIEHANSPTPISKSISFPTVHTPPKIFRPDTEDKTEVGTEINVSENSVLDQFENKTNLSNDIFLTTDDFHKLKTSDKKIKIEFESFPGSVDIRTGNDTTTNPPNQQFPIIHFVPTLTVLSGVTILIFLIGTKWLLTKHQKRKENKRNEQLKSHSFDVGSKKNSLTIENNLPENSVHLSEEVLNNTTPVLQTFKPLA